MNGFASHGLDEDAFGEKKGNIVQAFDYFRKYTRRSKIPQLASRLPPTTVPKNSNQGNTH